MIDMTLNYSFWYQSIPHIRLPMWISTFALTRTV